MTSDLPALTDKEKETLRLLLRGHDAKSSARELGLSVHTVNERLRDARRKLGVTSSREAARVLLAAEAAATPETFGDKRLGDAGAAVPEAGATASATRRRAGPHPASILIGVTAMSLILAALLLPASPLSVLGPVAMTETVAGAEPAAAGTRSEAEAAARAAEDFLILIDEGRWEKSYAATGMQFRKTNTLEVWTEVSQRMRQPLGKVLTRNIVTNEYVPAPPQGYQLVKFASSYADGTNQIESVSLEWEDGAWRVVGIVIG